MSEHPEIDAKIAEYARTHPNHWPDQYRPWTCERDCPECYREEGRVAGLREARRFCVDAPQEDLIVGGHALDGVVERIDRALGVDAARAQVLPYWHRQAEPPPEPRDTAGAGPDATPPAGPRSR